MKNDILNKISPDEALEILRQITKTDKKLKKRIVELAEILFRDVNVDEVCEGVFFALDGIDVHELWDRAGSSINGYTSPEDSTSEFKDWSADVPGESYSYIFNEWEKRGVDVKDKKEMRAFINAECPNWSLKL